MLSNGGGLPSNPLHAGPKQIQVRRVAVAEPQTKFGCGAEQQPIAQGESHFLYEWQERDSDLRAPCRSSDSGGLPPSPLRKGPKQIQVRRVAVAEPQIEFAFFDADSLSKIGRTHHLNPVTSASR